MIARGTTPTFVFTLPNTVDLTLAEQVYVTFASAGQTLTKAGGDDLTYTEHEIQVWLSQEETLAFGDNVEIQANWLMTGGQRFASEIVTQAFSKNLYRAVMGDD